MCTIMAAIGLVGTAVSAMGAIQQAKAASAAANYNAKVADMNAKISERRSEDALERGRQAEQRKRLEVAQIQGKQRAAMAANGVDLGFGAPLDTLIDTATMGEMDALTVRQNAAREAYDFRVDASNGRAEANLKRMEAKSALTGGYLAAAGTAISGIGGAYKSYYNQKMGYGI